MSLEETDSKAFSEHVDHASDSPPAAGKNFESRLAEFASAVELLGELNHASLEDVNECMLDTVQQLGKLADIVENSLSDFNDDDPDVTELVHFVVESCATIREAAFGDDRAAVDREQLECIKEAVEFRLESCDSIDDFGSVDEEFGIDRDADAGQDVGWDKTGEMSENGTDVVAPSQEEIAALLSGLSAQTSELTPNEKPRPTEDAAEPTETISAIAKPADGPKVGNSNIVRPDIDDVEVDEELREAFMDDATRGLESMEQALLDLESCPGDDGPVKTIGRELHTIKGASASISLANLASYIHEVEELIRQTQDTGQPVTPELLLPHVDLLRARVEGEQDPEESIQEVAAAATPSATTVIPPRRSVIGTANSIAPPVQGATVRQVTAQSTDKSKKTDGHNDDETVRVKSSQLNRLMDMLSELVMLRNQRDTEISELKGIHDELIYSVTRIRMLSHEGEALLAGDNLADPALAEDGVSFSHLNEVANDVLESAQRLRECYRPVADGNQAVSQFIRNFRLELVQLRRMPVSGLFRRLHRAISDAARTEKKQVRVELIGENTGIERSLQERIFEPLLHIVRNSVSHGIEAPDDRVAVGKISQGVVKLRAHSGPDLLVIEVQDDGRGLDYDAIRRRGIERGLIDGDKSTSHAELARLIFNPGFSTRETANQLSGRGVGMDVVASTLERMRGWVEVESEHGSGSTIRLSLPLPSMIQHAMVFRSGDQLFALPAQAVRRTGEYDPSLTPYDLNEFLSLSGDESKDEDDHSRRAIIELANGSVGDSGGDFTLLVDRVLGPEEVVVRPMPPMLKSHPLCIGATLSGMGEVVLLLDPRSLAEVAIGRGGVVESTPVQERPVLKELPKVLVVDDSKSARLRVTRALAKYPVTIVQVDDGQAAVEMLAKESFVTVFSDIDMPRMSGLELLQTVKREPRLESIPVIMISSRSIDTAGKQARAIGAMEYIQKPLVPERFDEVVAELSWAKT